MARRAASSALFDRGFNRFRDGYGRMLEGALHHRMFVLACAGALLVVSGGLTTVIGLDFFPSADVGLIKLHYRAPPGTRLEHTEQLVLQVEDSIRKIIPADELDTINDTVGVPSSFNLAFVPSDNVGGDGRGDPDLAEARAPSLDRLHPRHPRPAAGRVPRQHLLFPDRRHRQPGAEFRPVGADRRADPGRQLRACRRRSAAGCCSACSESPAWPTRIWCRC